MDEEPPSATASLARVEEVENELSSNGPVVSLGTVKPLSSPPPPSPVSSALEKQNNLDSRLAGKVFPFATYYNLFSLALTHKITFL